MEPVVLSGHYKIIGMWPIDGLVPILALFGDYMLNGITSY